MGVYRTYTGELSLEQIYILRSRDARLLWTQLSVFDRLYWYSTDFARQRRRRRIIMAQVPFAVSLVAGNQVHQHLRLLLWLGILTRVLVATLALLASYLPAFDSSADILLDDTASSWFKRWIATSLRWDSFHFLHIAQASYQYEYEWAFFPGVPLLSRISGTFLNLLSTNLDGPSMYTMLLGHFLLSALVARMTTRTMYILTFQHTQSPTISLLSASLSLLSSSPATLSLAPYAEPWFALLSYKGARLYE